MPLNTWLSTTGKLLLSGTGKVFVCEDCPCGGEVDCTECSGGTAPEQYTVTLPAGFTDSTVGNCTECESFFSNDYLLDFYGEVGGECIWQYCETGRCRCGGDDTGAGVRIRLIINNIGGGNADYSLVVSFFDWIDDCDDADTNPDIFCQQKAVTWRDFSTDDDCFAARDLAYSSTSPNGNICNGAGPYNDVTITPV